MIGLLAQKIGMTQVFDEKGRVQPVTILTAGPCPIVQVKTPETDGYAALQIGFGKKREALIPKGLQGHLKKHNAAGIRSLKEVRVDDTSPYTVGQELTVTLFEVGSKVDVIGVSKGKGFQGVMKRHHFRGGAASHGSMFHRAPGSIGSSAFPSRTFRGMRMGGRMGGDRVTIKNLEVLRVDEENNLLVLRGAVPGARGAFLAVRRSRAPIRVPKPPPVKATAKKKE